MLMGLGMVDPSSPPGDVTLLLKRWADGDEEALAGVLDHVYAELRNLALHHLRRERREHTLQPTALVNELYLKLANQDGMHWSNRRQFFALSSRIMRNVLVDWARAKRRGKRQAVLVTIDENLPAEAPLGIEELDEALTALEELFPRECRVVELRYFGGLTEEEIAETLDVSSRTVRRHWRFARHWLYDYLTRDPERESGSSEQGPPTS